MPNISQRNQSSVAGPYFVDQLVCNGCGICVLLAKENFRSDNDGLAFVAKQPRGSKQEACCAKALEQCPEFAIGKVD